MRLSVTKTFYALLAAGLLAISNVSHAAVYDFGTFPTESGGYTSPNSFQSATFSQPAATDGGEGVLNFMLSIKSNFFSDFGDKVFMGSMSFDITPDASVEDSIHWGNGSRSSNIGLTVKGIDVAYSASYVPVTSPIPEPESYAMIIAGLGLIAFTARRRKINA
ncbi:MAG TPA: PEP-CTERM sorting domain-containing protein [Gallionellaceae bacterium]|nr:PEP-CTERM sorting domain-containing protein [Gallionellaceae bacterium]